MKRRKAALDRRFGRFAHVAALFAGDSSAFVVSCVFVLIWLAYGPICGFSDEWYLLMSTWASVVAFLMVFLIQRSENKNSRAIHLKLNEIIASLENANNRMVHIEELPEEELEALQVVYRQLARQMADEVRATTAFAAEDAGEEWLDGEQVRSMWAAQRRGAV